MTFGTQLLGTCRIKKPVFTNSKSEILQIQDCSTLLSATRIYNSIFFKIKLEIYHVIIWCKHFSLPLLLRYIYIYISQGLVLVAVRVPVFCSWRRDWGKKLSWSLSKNNIRIDQLSLCKRNVSFIHHFLYDSPFWNDKLVQRGGWTFGYLIWIFLPSMSRCPKNSSTSKAFHFSSPALVLTPHQLHS